MSPTSSKSSRNPKPRRTASYLLRSTELLSVESELSDLLANSSLNERQKVAFYELLRSTFDLFQAPVTNGNMDQSLIDSSSIQLYSKMQALVTALSSLMITEEETRDDPGEFSDDSLYRTHEMSFSTSRPTTAEELYDFQPFRNIHSIKYLHSSDSVSSDGLRKQIRQDQELFLNNRSFQTYHASSSSSSSSSRVYPRTHARPKSINIATDNISTGQDFLASANSSASSGHNGSNYKTHERSYSYRNLVGTESNGISKDDAIISSSGTPKSTNGNSTRRDMRNTKRYSMRF